MQEDRKPNGPRDWREALKFRRSDTCILLGSGRSINGVAAEQWASLKKRDLWALNNWVYHPSVVPHFYHVEAKWYNYYVIQNRIKEKREAYRNVKFLFPRGKRIKIKDGTVCALHRVAFNGADKYDYDQRGRDMKRTHAAFSADYLADRDRLTKSYDMSLTAVLELIYRFGYETIVTYGIDLKDSYYFWTGGDRKYGTVHHQTNKAHENKDPTEPHATHRIKEFIVDFNERWLRPEGKGIYVGHRDTALYPELELKVLK